MSDDAVSGLSRARNREDDFLLELQRLSACYIMASADDRRVIWAVLNKYAPLVDF